MHKTFTAILLLMLMLVPQISFAEEPQPGKSAILVVSFGTSMPEAQRAIDNLVNAAKKEFPSSDVYLTFTSNIIRRKLMIEKFSPIISRDKNVNLNFMVDNLFLMNPVEILAGLNDNGYSKVCIMPTHIIPGEEYDEIANVAEAFSMLHGKYGFDDISLGTPFMYEPKDCARMAEILAERFKSQLVDEETGIILMGHGTPEHFANALYSLLQVELDRIAYGRFFIGTVEAAPEIDDVVANLKRHPEIKKLVLSPLMIVAGDHANNDLAGDEENSWLSILKAEGYENISTYLVGLGEDENIAKDFVQKIHELID
ncbi:MAG: sirohydrochlorin cobaltochelatase [Synergistaceae bacterium]|nr:sirohydrochlorin cobaltochelatase [Synergistaceae bacterium]